MMIRSQRWLGLVVLALAPAVCAGQEFTQYLQEAVLAPASQTASNTQNGRGNKPASSQAGMSEDTEIMRRILSRQLQAHQQSSCMSCHGGRFERHVKTGDWTQAGTNAFFYVGAPAKLPVSPGHDPLTLDVDGTYLKDYGVVFHVSMPAMLPVVTETAKAPTQAFSDWMRIRKELRGEKVDLGNKTFEKVTRDLDDVLLKCLADNGHNFSQLKDKENLTIIVSFRPAADPHAGLNRDSWRKQAAGIFAPGNANSGFTGTTTVGNPFTSTATTDGKPNGSGLIMVAPSDSSRVGDFELLADLQVQQGRLQEAIQAYQNAMATQPDSKRKASLYQKMAQAYLKLGERSPNAGTTAKAIEYLQLAQQSANTTSASTTPASTTRSLLTSKLIVTAPKSLLDAAAKGLSAEEFRKAAHVERITTPFTELREQPSAGKR
jgi:hypothetical protein